MQRQKNKIKPTRIYQSKKRKKYTTEDIFKLMGVDAEKNLKIYRENRHNEKIIKSIKNNSKNSDNKGKNYTNRDDNPDINLIKKKKDNNFENLEEIEKYKAENNKKLTQ